MAKRTRDVKELATALIQAAHAKGVAAEVLRNVRDVESAFRAHPEFASSFSNSAATEADRVRAMQKALHEHVHLFTENACLALLRRGLLKEIGSFAEAAAQAAERIADHREAVITTAVSMSTTESDKLSEALTHAVGGTHEMRERTDPSILGGLILEIRGRRYDASVLGRIRRLHSALSHS